MPHVGPVGHHPAEAVGPPAVHAMNADKRLSFARRISMDLMAVDIYALPEKAVRRGDLVTLIRR
jgi:alanine racemase